MVTQGVANHPFHHPLGQGGIDHAAQGLGQAGIADDPLDPGPKTENGLGAGKGGEILQVGGGGVDDVIDRFGGGFGHDIARNAPFGERFGQRGPVSAPVLLAGSHQDR